MTGDIVYQFAPDTAEITAGAVGHRRNGRNQTQTGKPAQHSAFVHQYNIHAVSRSSQRRAETRRSAARDNYITVYFGNNRKLDLMIHFFFLS